MNPLNQSVARELHNLKWHPRLQAHLPHPQEARLDDVIEALTAFGRFSLGRGEDWGMSDTGEGWIVCSLRWRPPVDSGPIICSGQSPLVASLRCLLLALQELDRGAQAGIDELSAFLANE